MKSTKNIDKSKVQTDDIPKSTFTKEVVARFAERRQKSEAEAIKIIRDLINEPYAR